MRDSYNTSPKCDLQHRDWLLKSSQALIARVDPNISTKIIDTEDGGKRLLVNYVSESAIQELLFLTNTDQNNNYWYLEFFSCTIEGDLEPLEFPGLSQIMVKIFESSDLNGFIGGSKTHQPFNPSSFRGVTINQFIDNLSFFLPFVPSTSGKVKHYNLIFNPDNIKRVLYSDL